MRGSLAGVSETDAFAASLRMIRSRRDGRPGERAPVPGPSPGRPDDAAGIRDPLVRLSGRNAEEWPWLPQAGGEGAGDGDAALGLREGVRRFAPGTCGSIRVCLTFGLRL